MRKKILTTILVLCFVLVSVVSPAFASTKDSRVTIGADNTEEQVNTVYSFFGIDRGNVQEIQVTNQEERKYLADWIPEEKIGNIAISCSYIETRDSGGIELETHNINYVTAEMYKNALATAGITDAKVIVAAYRPVSGTGALTGIYKAYEDITGEVIDESLKEVATAEMVITGEIQDTLGDASPEFINELKLKLELTKDMTDAEIRVLIVETAEEYDAELTDEQIEQILKLVKKMNELGVDAETFIKITETGESIKSGADSFFEAVGNFFKGIGDFVSGLFGSGDNVETQNDSTGVELAN